MSAHRPRHRSLLDRLQATIEEHSEEDNSSSHTSLSHHDLSSSSLYPSPGTGRTRMAEDNGDVDAKTSPDGSQPPPPQRQTSRRSSWSDAARGGDAASLASFAEASTDSGLMMYTSNTQNSSNEDDDGETDDNVGHSSLSGLQPLYEDDAHVDGDGNHRTTDQDDAGSELPNMGYEDPNAASTDSNSPAGTKAAVGMTSQTTNSPGKRTHFQRRSSFGSNRSLQSIPLRTRSNRSVFDKSQNESSSPQRQTRRVTMHIRSDEQQRHVPASTRLTQSLHNSYRVNNDFNNHTSSLGGSSHHKPTRSRSILQTLRRHRNSILRTNNNNSGGNANQGANGNHSPNNGSSNTNSNANSNNNNNPNTGSSSRSMAEAVGRLGELPSHDFDHVAAAAAVVAASAPSAQRSHVQFGQGDYVLVILTLLGLADPHNDQHNHTDRYTVDPVNRLGYPHGEGKTDAERTGPYLFVLCQVTQVHFDEDERYYTVRRCDTGTDQRADPGFMEPLDDSAAIEFALRAAQRTEHLERPAAPPRTRWCQTWAKSVGRSVGRRYVRTRAACKVVVEDVLHGNQGCAVQFRWSGINALVVCSLIFLFEEVVRHAFLSRQADQYVAIVTLIVWIILALELLLEFLIRPAHYHQLMQTDKAFAPANARHINRYHLLCEALALCLNLPRVPCAVLGQCGEVSRWVLTSEQAPVWALTSLNAEEAVLGRFLLGLTFLRTFGLVRHWKQMWINHTFENSHEEKSMVRRLLFVEETKSRPMQKFFSRKKKQDEDDTLVGDESDSKDLQEESSEEDKQLKNAANIGTALMLVNSHRALFILLYSSVVNNPVSYNDMRLLQANNVISNRNSDCEYLRNAVESWFKSTTTLYTAFDLLDGNNDAIAVLWAQLLPVRCDWQRADGVITFCNTESSQNASSVDASRGGGSSWCNFWNAETPDNEIDATREYYGDILDVRPGALIEISYHETSPANFVSDDMDMTEFSVRAIFNYSHGVALTHLSLFLLLTSMIMLGLIGLTVMRADAERLVLYPLQRMLMIVVRYAENPLSTPSSQSRSRKGGSISHKDSNGRFDDSEEVLGHYETEQLINAIAKIADLLRKCWGVAGAGIISSNLARTKDGRTVVFNPTIPGKQVYALFAFIGINDFSKQLRALEKDVMILINDVARVVHDEVYRWALGDSGQCNKNLGSAFLMVFRIGDFLEVHDKKKRATDVVFNSQHSKVRQRNSSNKTNRRGSNIIDRGGGTLQLASLPGIQAFADRALLGCLKSFAGLHRDQRLQNWQKDFRLGAGVGNFTINVIYGMDAGWAVEGAVGSEYKIDATYLSPHVNMASRMMSACKQYGVKILLSQAVEELLSKPARSKLRHLDTVYVKGSNVDQRIYTYDARYEGADFFLFERSPDQADIEAEAYAPSIWEVDQDLKSMRQHVSDEFADKFRQGMEEYLEGKWKLALRSLHEADDLMFEAVLEQGYVDYITEDYGEYGKNTKADAEELALLKEKYGDGASKCLIQYMERRDGIPPAEWHGVRHLMFK